MYLSPFESEGNAGSIGQIQIYTSREKIRAAESHPHCCLAIEPLHGTGLAPGRLHNSSHVIPLPPLPT